MVSMLIVITAFLTISHLSGAQDVKNRRLARNNEISAGFYNDTNQQLDRLQTENEELRKKIDLLTVNIHQQLMLQQMELRRNLHDLLTSIAIKMKQPTELKTNTSTTPVEQMRPSIDHDAIPTNCAEALRKSGLKGGVHKIKIIDSDMKPFYIYCLTNSNSNEPIDDEIRADVNSAWTIIQRRIDGSVDFNRNWVDYQLGFGNLEGEYWIGLDKLNALTQSALHELWVQLEDFEGARRWAKYQSFAIGGANEGYPISVLGAFTGNAGDSMSYHIAQRFSTKDMDNDTYDIQNCALSFQGGWWYKDCFYSELNGRYYHKNNSIKTAGIMWNGFRGKRYSLKYAHMAIRPIQP